MINVAKELEETRAILENLAEILEWLDDVPTGCKGLTQLAVQKVENAMQGYCFPEEEE